MSLNSSNLSKLKFVIPETVIATCVVSARRILSSFRGLLFREDYTITQVDQYVCRFLTFQYLELSNEGIDMWKLIYWMFRFKYNTRNNFIGPATVGLTQLFSHFFFFLHKIKISPLVRDYFPHITSELFVFMFTSKFELLLKLKTGMLGHVLQALSL